MKTPDNLRFVNANLEPVAYDGSEITWRVSAYVFVIRDKKLLLAKNKLEKFCDVLGGAIDIGETIEQALEREAVEEGGVRIKVGRHLFNTMDWFYHRTGKFHQTLQLYYEAEQLGEAENPTDPNIEWARFIPLCEVGSKYQLSMSPQALKYTQDYLASKNI